MNGMEQALSFLDERGVFTYAACIWLRSSGKIPMVGRMDDDKYYETFATSSSVHSRLI